MINSEDKKTKFWKVTPNLINAFFLKKYPVSLTHFITEKCNARCPHCFIDFDKDYNNELKLDEIEKIASSTGNCLMNVSITGGEPFLRQDIFEIVNIWHKNSTAQHFTIPTNGSLPNKIEEFALLAAKNNIPVSFCFSYDFIGEKHSDYRKIKDLHLKVIESQKIIQSFKNKFNTTFQITLNPSNVDSAFETYQYIRDILNIENISCVLFRGEEANKLNINEKKLLAIEYEKIQKQINDDYDNGKIKGLICKDFASLILNTKNKMYWQDILKTFNNNSFIAPCMAGSLFGIIHPNGDVSPCELLNDSFGNLKDYDYNFMNLWNTSQNKEIKKRIINSKCRCTFECVWTLNTFSQIKFYPKIIYNMLKNLNK